jgi:hypothetical protein
VTRIRSGRLRIISRRSASDMEPQRAISSSERPQPRQSLLAESIVQTLVQGDETMASE